MTEDDKSKSEVVKMYSIEEVEVWGHGGMGYGGMEVWGKEAWGYGVVRRHGGMEVWGHGGMGVWMYGAWIYGGMGCGGMGCGCIGIWRYGCMGYGGMGAWRYGVMEVFGCLRICLEMECVFGICGMGVWLYLGRRGCEGMGDTLASI